MRSHPERKWIRAALQPAPVLCILMIVALWTVLTFVLLTERQRTLETAIQQGNNLVRLFQHDTDSMLKSVDRTSCSCGENTKKIPAISISELW